MNVSVLASLARACRARASVANAIVVAGGVTLVLAGASMARGAVARDAVRTLWEQREAQRAALGARALVSGGRDWAAARGAPVARLQIPRLGLDEVVVEGVGEAELRAGPGHMIGSALPGARGNAVISAHRDRHFRAFGRLAVGDTVTTESDGGTVRWIVTTMRVVAAADAKLRSTDDRRLTLTTCWPVRYFGTAPDRLIVEAAPIG